MSLGPRKAGTALVSVLVLIFTVGAHSTAFAVRSSTKHRKPSPKLNRTSHHRFRFLWHPMFRPSHQSLLRQNEEIDRLELPRIQDDAELEQLKASHALVPLEESETLRIQPSLEPSRRYCRPWTRNFVADLSEAYYREFHDQIQVNSAVRTVKVQKKLRRHNRNAAPAEGETASSHLAGITVDLQRRGMTKEEVRFVERYLFYLRELGLVEPEEERRHWCFHIMVSDRYDDWRQNQTVFPLHPAETTVTAMGASN